MANAAGRRVGTLWTNRVANPLLRALLKGRLGHRAGRRLAVLRYAGRRTGLPRELVVQYVHEGDRVWVVPGHPERKRWWRNLVEPAPVELWLAGERARGTAVAVRAGRGLLADALTTYRRAFPHARTEDATVVVRIDLDRAGGERGSDERAQGPGSVAG